MNRRRGAQAAMGALLTIAIGWSVPAGAQTGADEAAVQTVEETFVDESRPTSANGDCDEIASRTLPTTVYVPGSGDGPHPLIVFAHGFSATPQVYDDLLRHLAAQGYVVAAPTFPLSSADSPCGPVAGDVANQPEDMSFVIDEVLERSGRGRGPLADLVDRRSIGAAGHSNGGITMYGLVANIALRDQRVDAVAVLGATAQKLPRGRFDFDEVPPIMIVHGTDDELISYDHAVDAFNRARGPKGLLTLTGGNHGSSAGGATFAPLTDFFDAYVRGDTAALARIPDDQTPGESTMIFDEDAGSTTTIPTQPKVKRDLKATVTPRKNLTGGQIVTVEWSGYTPGKAISVLECNPSNRDLSNSVGCDYTKAALLHPNPTGEGSLQLEIVEGVVGDGTCDAKHPGCFILVNNESSTDPENSVFVNITFARG
jgi:dienelactone hydrolase